MIETRRLKNVVIFIQTIQRKNSKSKQLAFSTRMKFTAHKMKFSIKYFFCKNDQIQRKLQSWSYLLKESLMENFMFLCSECFPMDLDFLNYNIFFP